MRRNEIPAVQALLAELGIAGHLVTLNALHCQKTFRIFIRPMAHDSKT